VPSLAVPTLVVIGDRDTSFVGLVPGVLERLPAALTSWVTLEGAGHAANLSSPAEFNAAVIAFAVNTGYLSSVPPRAATSRINRGLTVLGCALIVAGLAMLGGAFFWDRGGADVPAAFEPFGPTPTAVDQVSGVSTAGPGNASMTPTSAATVVGTATIGATPTLEATATATTVVSTATPPPAATPQPADTPTPIPADTPTLEPTATTQPTATPTLAPQPTATPPRFVSIAGPSTADPGQPVLFTATAHESPAFGWEWEGCFESLANTTCTGIFSAPGCYPVTLTGKFIDGNLSASRMVSAGGATC
jgi:hypothetical protein